MPIQAWYPGDAMQMQEATMQPEEPDLAIVRSQISADHGGSDYVIHQTSVLWRRVRFVALLALLGALLFAQRNQITAVFFAKWPAPVPTNPLPTQLMLDIFTNVSQGTLTVNGEIVPYLPGSFGQSRVVLRQHMIIAWNAPPF